MACLQVSVRHLRGESGQSAILVLGLIAALLLGALVLTAFGQAMGAKFEPAVLPGSGPNPRHLSTTAYLARAREAALRAARRNGVRIAPADVSFPGGSFAPTRVAVRARGSAEVRLDAGRRSSRGLVVRARAVAELSPVADDGLETFGSGGGYDGPLAYRQGKPMRYLWRSSRSCGSHRCGGWMTRPVQQR